MLYNYLWIVYVCSMLIAHMLIFQCQYLCDLEYMQHDSVCTEESFLASLQHCQSVSCAQFETIKS